MWEDAYCAQWKVVYSIQPLVQINSFEVEEPLYFIVWIFDMPMTSPLLMRCALSHHGRKFIIIYSAILWNKWNTQLLNLHTVFSHRWSSKQHAHFIHQLFGEISRMLIKIFVSLKIHMPKAKLLDLFPNATPLIIKKCISLQNIWQWWWMGLWILMIRITLSPLSENKCISLQNIWWWWMWLWILMITIMITLCSAMFFHVRSKAR